MPDNKIKLGVLWRETSQRDGSTYLSGPVSETMRLLVFPTSADAKAKNPKCPDFTVYLVPNEQKKKNEEPHI